MLFETISLAGDTPSIYHYSSLQQDDCRQHNFHLLLEQKTLCFEESSPSQLPKSRYLAQEETAIHRRADCKAPFRHHHVPNSKCSREKTHSQNTPAST